MSRIYVLCVYSIICISIPIVKIKIKFNGKVRRINRIRKVNRIIFLLEKKTAYFNDGRVEN